MKSILLTIFFFAAVATAKCETPATAPVKSDVKTEAPATETNDATAATKDAAAKGTALVGTSDMYLKLVRDGVKHA